MKRGSARPQAARVGSAVLALALVACGGGGGDGSDTASAGSGLMPAAPAPGAVLVADAATLRPLRDGATWRFHGLHFPGPNSVPSVYENIRRAAVHPEGGFTESDSNSFRLGDDTVRVELRNGNVVRLETMVLSPESPAEGIVATELRSPVRQNDQYTVVDRRISAGLPDADGDRVAEDLDIAAYRRVMGEETVVLGALGARRTIRVDFVTLARARLSRDGRLSPVVRVERRDWYEAGVGLVKSTLVQPLGTETQTTTEELVSWDGVERGLGVLPPVVLRAPAGQPGWADAPPSQVRVALKLGDRIAIAALGAVRGQGVVMTADTGGTIRALWRMDALTADPIGGLWTSDGDRLLLLHYHWPDTRRLGWMVKAFGSDAQPIGPPEGLPLQHPPAGPAGGEVWLQAVAADAGRFWALWRARPEGEAGRQLLLGAFDAQGRLVGPVHRLDGTDGEDASISERDPSSGQGPQLAVGPAGVLATWRRGQRQDTDVPGSVTALRYAWLPTGATAPVVRTLTTDTSRTWTPDLLPAVAGTRGILAWSYRIGFPGSATPSGQVVRLDTDGLPLFAPGQDALNAAHVDTRRECAADSSLAWVVGDERGAVLSSSAECKLWLDDWRAFPTRHPLRHLMIDDRGVPLPDVVPSLPRVTRHGQSPGTPVLFADRLIVVTSGGSIDSPSIQFTTVWRR